MGGRVFFMTERTVREDLSRFLEEYNWGWGLSHKVINWFHGTSFTISELKKLYKMPEPDPEPPEASKWVFRI